ncbi:MAG: VTT domain-containing protein [Microbacterium sp.]|uniref:DedA family protein n=1 Tax=Microbacterium sp. TaxID=51671 RepID=UPI00271FDC63|nr:VTT domain-containing protein [Microbacterium sp.]MDO8381995.1 VTT domain-containing protein [Microbacterium sp.]
MSDVLSTIAASPWALVAMFGLVLGDAFLVVIPGETAVTALAALSVVTGEPGLVGIIAVAALAAFLGDTVCYLVGRRVGLERWAWMRRPRIAGAFSWARARLARSTAAIVFTARFIPFARLAVNLTAGASGVTAPRYLPLAALAALGWACYQALVGTVVATLLPDAPVLAILASIAVALLLGVALDAALAARWRRTPRA